MKPRVQQSPASINATASQWVTRRRAGLSPAEETELSQWLAEYPANLEAYNRLAAMSEAIQRARESGAAAAIVTQLETRARKRRNRRRALASAAAVLFLATILSLPGVRSTLSQLRTSNSESRIPNSDPTISDLRSPLSAALRRLPDGSIVELKTGAEIAVRFEPSARRVELLRGEALFRVEKDADRPFIVRAQGIDVRAVGTAFNIRLERAAVEILVTEGKVQVADAAHGSSLLPAVSTPEPPVLSAGQSLTVDTAQLTNLRPQTVTALTNDEIKQQLAWRVPRFEFDGVDLSSAVQQMNRENRVQITLADEGLSSLHLSGTFSPDDPATFARLVAATFGLKVEKRGEAEIVLRK